MALANLLTYPFIGSAANALIELVGFEIVGKALTGDSFSGEEGTFGANDGLKTGALGFKLARFLFSSSY